MEFIVKSKADSLFKVVSASSIVAKVNRDYAVKFWQFRETDKNNQPVTTENIGCGYPSDPKTKAWLRKYADSRMGLPEIVRFSWKTTENVLNSIGCHFTEKSRFRDLALDDYYKLGFESSLLSKNDFRQSKNNFYLLLKRFIY